MKKIEKNFVLRTEIYIVCEGGDDWQMCSLAQIRYPKKCFFQKALQN